jgi:tetratricopeptide (TPR) repeat protein
MSKENQLPEENEILDSEEVLEEGSEEITEAGEEISENTGIMGIVQQHRNNILIAGGVLLVAILYFAFFAGSSPEKEDNAGNAMFMAVRYYENDSLNLALNGDGNNPGLLDLASEYSGTRAGNLCNFYIGAIYLRQGNAAEALNYFDAVKKEENFIAASAYAAMASITEDQGDMSGAGSLYEKAAALRKNEYTTPFFLQQAGRCYLQAEDKSAALRMYKRIREEYPNSQEGQQVNKYIAFLAPDEEI